MKYLQVKCWVAYQASTKEGASRFWARIRAIHTGELVQNGRSSKGEPIGYHKPAMNMTLYGHPGKIKELIKPEFVANASMDEGNSSRIGLLAIENTEKGEDVDRETQQTESELVDKSQGENPIEYSPEAKRIAKAMKEIMALLADYKKIGSSPKAGELYTEWARYCDRVASRNGAWMLSTINKLRPNIVRYALGFRLTELLDLHLEGFEPKKIEISESAMKRAIALGKLMVAYNLHLEAELTEDAELFRKEKESTLSVKQQTDVWSNRIANPELLKKLIAPHVKKGLNPSQIARKLVCGQIKKNFKTRFGMTPTEAIARVMD